jgi:hypothetical protein
MWMTLCSRGRRWLGCLVIAVIGLVVIISLIPLLIIPMILRQTTTQIESVIPQIISTVFMPGFLRHQPQRPLRVSPPWRFEFWWGGTGAGLLKMRTGGVDGEGASVWAKYLGGSVQVFDSAGKFLTQWLVDGSYLCWIWW